MYHISADTSNNLITVELFGYMEVGEWHTFIKEVSTVAEQFKRKELFILISLERLDALSQESLPICIEGLVIAADYVAKVAFIHKRVITRMQLGKMLAAVNKRCGNAFEAQLFTSRREAMAYLLGRN